MHLPSTRFCLLSLMAVASAGAVAAQSIELYGQGTAGTGGKVPAWWPTTTARENTPSFSVKLTNGLANAPVIGYASPARADFRFQGVRVLINLGFIQPLPFGATDSKGEYSFKLPIPNIPQVRGLTQYAQAFIADSGSAARIGLSATPGLRVTINRPGVLVGTGTVVDLAANRAVALSAPGFTPGNQASWLRDRRHVLVTGRDTSNNGEVALFELKDATPRFVKKFKTEKVAWAASPHPDGLRAYLVNQGPGGTNTNVQVFWAVPALPNFGTEIKAQAIPIGNVLDAIEMLFTDDGKIGVLGSLGLIGGSTNLRFYDTDRSSNTFHKLLGTVSLGGFMFSYAVLPDNKRIAATHASLGSQGVVSLVDIATRRVIDADPNTPAIDPLGPINRVSYDMAVGPRGKYLYLGTSYPTSNRNAPGELRRYGIDPNDSDYRKMTVVPLGPARGGVRAVAVSDAGDLVYAHDGTTAYELDAQTLKVKRSWRFTTGWHMATR